ncbi:MAG: hypothetical protein BWY09_00261 [Candidatus Hydrogenedentes bacterium ADurb.Bin179]|nr:MAG: hypothetical protein BWY09_00261 [Candidatus Hydrogenedentes bacterium ADurb.Bin179]
MKKRMVYLVVFLGVGLICFALVQMNRTGASVAVNRTEPVSTPVSSPDTKAAPLPDEESLPPQNTVSPATVPEAALASVQSPTPLESVGQAAIDKAARENKYLFLFFSENDSPETEKAKASFESAAGNMEDVVQLAYVDKNQPSEKAVVERFRLDGAPMPLVLAMAPNGAVTGAYFGDKMKEPKLEESIAGPGEQQCMKALQEGKLVLVSLQNAVTTSNEQAMQGVEDFKADTRFAEATELVAIDPANESDQGFLAKLRIDSKIQEATTAFLAPPGSLIKTITGATTKDELVATLTAATAGGCGSSCKPGACGPRR